MAETPPPPSSEPNTPPSSAAEQARIRKERREAKIRAGGSARLNKITGLGGGIQRGIQISPPAQLNLSKRASLANSPTDPPPQPTVSEPKPNDAADPEEVDISQHFYQPSTTSRPRIPQQPPLSPDAQLSEDQLRAMMLGFPSSGRDSPQPPPRRQQQQQPLGANPNPFAGFPGMEGLAGPGGPGGDDPMLKLLQQMMSSMGGSIGDGAGGPPGGGMPGMPFPPTAMPGSEAAGAAAMADSYAYLWRIVHAVFALGLGLYIALTAEFTGSKLARDMSAVTNTTGAGGEGGGGVVRFFYIFATTEVVLQSFRFFVEKGTVQPGGVLRMVMGFLPQPWKGYLALLLRYGRIWTTTSSDALVCVFVLGVCSWLRAV